MNIFNGFADIIVYIDNIILFTKDNFDHHVERLGAVLQVLLKNNLHVHVEETFLASDSVDYLGYTLTTQGIRPQVKKYYQLFVLQSLLPSVNFGGFSALSTTTRNYTTVALTFLNLLQEFHLARPSY